MNKYMKRITAMSLSSLMLFGATSFVYASGVSARASGMSDEAVVRTQQNNTIATFHGSTVKETKSKDMGMSVISIDGVDSVDYWPIKLVTGNNIDLGNGISVRKEQCETEEMDLAFDISQPAIGTELGIELQNTRWNILDDGVTVIWANWR